MDVVDGQTVPWQTDGTRHTNLSYGDKTGLLAVTTDPEQFFNALTEAGATVRQTGAHTYHFDAALMPRRGLASGHLSGDVTVDPSGRIAQVVYEAVLRGTAETAPGTVLAGTLELSGYGSKVTVDRPGGTFEQLPGKPAPEPKPVK
jgi:hypothetical protein